MRMYGRCWTQVLAWVSRLAFVLALDIVDHITLASVSCCAPLRIHGCCWTQVLAWVCRLAFFVALDVFDHLGLILRSAIYMVMYYSFAQPRAIIWQMYLVTYAIMYACTGMAYLLSQVSPHAGLGAVVQVLFAFPGSHRMQPVTLILHIDSDLRQAESLPRAPGATRPGPP